MQWQKIELLNTTELIDSKKKFIVEKCKTLKSKFNLASFKLFLNKLDLVLSIKYGQFMSKQVVDCITYFNVLQVLK